VLAEQCGQASRRERGGNLDQSAHIMINERL